MAKYKVSGFPSQNVPKAVLQTTMQPVSRNIANVEAEKGEVVVTNSTRGSKEGDGGQHNYFDMFDIGGKKHYDGGTPLLLATDGEGEGNGTSFIFSDNKKMIVKDPKMLEYFGVNPKKPQTFADISRNWVESVNKSKQILINSDADAVTKKSAEMTMENAAFKIAALKLLQESGKNGFGEGIPNNLDVFFDKLQVDPNSLFAMNQGDADKTNQAVTKAFGGMVNSNNNYDEFPSLSKGGELPKADKGANVQDPKDDLTKFGKSDPTAEKQFAYIRDVLANDDNFKAALKREYEDAASHPENFGAGYNDAFKLNPASRDLVIKKDANAIFADYLEFQKRNLMLKSHGRDVKGSGQQAIKGQVSNKNITEWATAHGVPLPNRDGVASQQLSYIAFNNLAANKDKYNAELAKVMQPFEAEKSGAGDEIVFGSSEKGSISKADGVYTDTTGGENSKFTFKEPEASKAIVDNKEPSYQKPTNYRGLGATKTLNNPYALRREDQLGIDRAMQARWEIPEIHPWAKAPSIVFPETVYDSPERKIAAQNEQLGMFLNSGNAFATSPGQAAANYSNVVATAYGNVADAIDKSATVNENLFTNNNLQYTQLANQQNAVNAQMSTDQVNKENTLKQNLANSVGIAKDKITNLVANAWTNATDRFNLNALNENKKLDPITGQLYLANEKPLTPTRDTSKSFGEEFNVFASSMPADVSNDLKVKAFLAYKSGKYVLDPVNDVTKVSDLNNYNT